MAATVSEAGRAVTLGEKYIMPAAAVAAAHGAAVLAWQHERLSILKETLAVMRGRAGWVQLHLLGDRPAALAGWLVRALGASHVMARAHQQHLITTKALTAIGGLTIIGDLASAHGLDKYAESGLGAPTYWYPGYYEPLVQWIDDLPDVFPREPSLERKVARDVFGMEPAALRLIAKRLGPVVCRARSNANGGALGGLRWISRPGETWDRWAGEPT